VIQREHMNGERPDGQRAAAARDPLRPPGTATGSSAPAGLVDELTELMRTMRRIAALELARARVQAERSALVVARGLVLALAAAALGGAMVLLVVFGLVGGLSALSGWPLWLSALALGIAGPTVAYLLVRLALARRERKRLTQLAEGSREGQAAKRRETERVAAERLAAGKVGQA
jgi:membrane protein implicated in regulation of membrane protease activity